MNQYVIFRLGQQEYGIPIDMTREILRIPEITPLPNMPAGLQGVINLRGTVLPVWDLQIRFGGNPLEKTADSRLLVLQTGEQITGVTVDDVTEVADFDEKDLERLSIPWMNQDQARPEHVLKQGERLILILSEDMISTYHKQGGIAS